jgi:MoaA/NifB/PqqE/SkfB family radical SAM enzyme
MPPGLFHRLEYSPLLAQVVIIRRCNLTCGYCSEHDGTGLPVPVEVLEQRLAKLHELGTFGIGLTGGEPTLHPDLARVVRACRELGFLRTGLITNGFLLRPDVIDQLNDAGLQHMQISIDGVFANETTQKVLTNLKKRLEWLSQWARFDVVVNAVIGACPPDEALDVIEYARELGFRPRVQLVPDVQGRLLLGPRERQLFYKIVRRLPRMSMGFSGYQRRLIRGRPAPFKCRAGSRYLYVDEYGRVARCSKTRDRWSRPLVELTPADLYEQFYAYKPCHATCTLGAVRFASELDGWRRQEQPGLVPISPRPG